MRRGSGVRSDRIWRAGRIAATWLLAACLTPGWPAAYAESSGAAAAPVQASEVERHWEQVRALMKRGAWREALQELEMLAVLTPGDGRVAAYRAPVAPNAWK